MLLLFTTVSGNVGAVPGSTIGSLIVSDSDTVNLSYSCIGCTLDERHPLMHLDPGQLDKIATNAATRVVPRMSAMSTVGYPSSMSLLSRVPYVPLERDQGICGNCWVWAATRAAEVDHNFKSGVADRLSVQYFNSKYNNGEAGSFACCGGR